MPRQMDVGLVCPWLVGECGFMDDGHMDGGFQCIK